MRGRPKAKEPKNHKVSLRLDERSYTAIQQLAEDADKSMSYTIDMLIRYAVLNHVLFKGTGYIPTKEQLQVLKERRNISNEITDIFETWIDLDEQFSEFSKLYLKST